jgi:hypothetical protein
VQMSMPLSNFTDHHPVIDGMGRWIDIRITERIRRSQKHGTIEISSLNKPLIHPHPAANWSNY